MVEYSLNYLRNRYANIDHRSPKTPGPNYALFFWAMETNRIGISDVI